MHLKKWPFSTRANSMWRRASFSSTEKCASFSATSDRHCKRIYSRLKQKCLSHPQQHLAEDLGSAALHQPIAGSGDSRRLTGNVSNIKVLTFAQVGSEAPFHTTLHPAHKHAKRDPTSCFKCSPDEKNQPTKPSFKKESLTRPKHSTIKLPRMTAFLYSVGLSGTVS